MFVLLSILFTGNLLQHVHSQSYATVTNLRTTLLASYNPDVVPVNDYSKMLNINLSASLILMPEVDPVRGAVKIGIMSTQEWFDELITLTPADYGGMSQISIKSEDVWTPPLAVANPVKFTLIGHSWLQVNFLSNGKATYAAGGLVDFSCSFNMKFWPFDKQVCSLAILPYGYAFNKVAYSVPGPAVITNFYIKNGEWYLEEKSFDYKIDNDIGMSRLTFSFKIARQPVFYLLTIIIPINGIGALTCLVFLLPSEAGERVSYSITILLSLAVFLTVISDELPKNSEPIPVMCIYIILNIIVCICGLILVILSLALYHRNETTQKSRFYQTLLRMSRCQSRVQDTVRSISIKKATPNVKLSIAIKDKKNLVNSRSLVSEDSGVTTDISEHATWKDVSQAVDKVLFYVLVITTYVPSTVILTYKAVASDYDSQ